MPTLKIRCVLCKQWVSTGLDVDYETYKNMTYTDRVLECPRCEKTQTWNLDDVDRSVFGNTPKK